MLLALLARSRHRQGERNKHSKEVMRLQTHQTRARFLKQQHAHLLWLCSTRWVTMSAIVHGVLASQSVATDICRARLASTVAMGARLCRRRYQEDVDLELLADAFPVVWQCQEQDWDCWYDYEPNVNKRIEWYWDHDGRWAPAGNADDPERFLIDFVRMRQVSHETDTIRRVRRTIVTHS